MSSHSSVTHFWVKENLRSKESLIANVDGERLFGDGVLTFKNFDPLGRFRVILGEFLDNVRAHV